MLDYLNLYLRDSNRAADPEKRLFYYTMGEEAWKVTSTWPPAGATPETWFMGSLGQLTRELPDSDSGRDAYAVDFEATTGKANRWWAQDGVTKEHYGDRAKADERLLTYTSEPLTEDMEVTGHPIVTLYTTSSETDGAFLVYLEDVDESGKVTYLTEGHLRAIHRHITDRQPPFRLFVPHHSFLRADATPIVPGEVAELRFGLLPVSARVRKGHRLRVAIGGHDKDTFARIPGDAFPTITVERNRVHASRIELPVVRA